MKPIRTVQKRLAVSVVAVLLLAACGGGSGDDAGVPTDESTEESGNEDEAEAAPDALGEVSVWKYGSPPVERDYFAEQSQIFADDSGAAVEIEFLDWPERVQSVLSANASDTLPDVLAIENSMLPELVAADIIVPLADVGVDVDSMSQNYNESLWDLGVWDGEVYGFSPYVDLSPMLIYNSEMFAAAGLDPPETWSDVLAAAEALNQPDRAGIVFPASGIALDTDIFESVVYNNGGRWIDEASGDVVIDGPGAVEALEFYAELAEFAPSGLVDTAFRDAVGIFFNERAAMMIMKSFSPILQDDLEFPADFPATMIGFPQPDSVGGSSESASFVAQAPFLFVATRQVRDSEATASYLEFWGSPDQHFGWDGSVITGRVPSTTVLLESDGFAGQYEGLSAQYQDGTLFQNVEPLPSFRGHSELQEDLGAAIQRVLLGQQSADEALAEVGERARSTIDQ